MNRSRIKIHFHKRKVYPGETRLHLSTWTRGWSHFQAGPRRRGRGHGTSSPSSRSRAPVQDKGGAREEAARGPACSGHLWSSRGHRRDLVSEVVPFRGSTAAGEERGGGERWRQEEDRDGRAVVLSGEACTPTRGQVGGRLSGMRGTRWTWWEEERRLGLVGTKPRPRRLWLTATNSGEMR